MNTKHTVTRIPAMNTKHTMTMEDFEELAECYGGMCLACGALAYDGCEPDARGYECEECGARKVYGAEECLIMGLVH